MDRDTKLFYMSGFLSLFLFSFFLFSFFYMMMASSKIKSYALKKEEYISVSLYTPPTPKKEQQSTKSANIVKEVTPVVPKKSVSTNEMKHKDVDVSDLFSNVWTKKVVIDKKEPKKKTLDKRRILEITKETKYIKKQNQNSQKVSKELEKLQITQKNTHKKKASTAQEVNEYLAKINALVYRYFNPPQNSQGHSVKAVIELSPIGKVIDFRILSYSANQLLNNECDRLKERLKDVVFPINPQNRSSRTIVILTAKE